jgi:hypothetical protein
MKTLFCLSIILSLCLCTLATSQSVDTSGVWKMLPDSSGTTKTAADSTIRMAKTDSLHTPPGIITDTLVKKTGVSNLKLIKRNYNSRQQILLASGMMIFIITMMTLAQQFNPN